MSNIKIGEMLCLQEEEEGDGTAASASGDAQGGKSEGKWGNGRYDVSLDLDSSLDLHKTL